MSALPGSAPAAAPIAQQNELEALTLWTAVALTKFLSLESFFAPRIKYYWESQHLFRSKAGAVMSDEVIGTCCAVAVTACLDVISGICIDLTSIRHSCTETMCRCSCLACRKHAPIDDPQEERDPLLPSNTQQPSSHSPMRSHSH